MIVNLCFICSMKSFWFTSSIIFTFFEREKVFCIFVIDFVIDWKKDYFDSKMNWIDILIIDWVSEISNNASILSNVKLLNCFVRCLRKGILSMIYRFDEESDMYIYRKTLVVHFFAIDVHSLRDRCTPPSHYIYIPSK